MHGAGRRVYRSWTGEQRRELVFGRTSRDGKVEKPRQQSRPAPLVRGSLCAAVRYAAQAETVADFYKGKSVSLIAGFPPGGGYDTYVRVLARHYGRFIPGQPSIVASNMPGAGSLTAANNIYSKAAADGTALGMFAASAAMAPLLGKKAAPFDTTKFSWIGSMSQDVAYCGVWQTPGAAKTFDEMMTKETISEAAERRRSRFSTRW